ncbi:MAG: hypothetical protein L6Q84_26815 [Polyangiaceae bacterium]|nr:hypothetical protein [Polyangiaceae bacterium]
MTQGTDVVDAEIRHSLRVIKAERNLKLVAFVIVAVATVAALFVGAFLGLV